MQSIGLVLHVILAAAVIGLVLMQHGKGADAGAAFGSGASATVFGARGSASFLTRATTLLAAAFFCTSMFLFYLAAHRDSTTRSVTELPGITEEAQEIEAPSDLPGGIELDAEQIGDDASSALEGATDAASDAVNSATDAASDAVDTATDAASDAVNSATDAATEAVDTATDALADDLPTPPK